MYEIVRKIKSYRRTTMEHDITLNIHYSAPEEIWKKIDSVYKNMPYWKEDENSPHWTGDDIDLYASVEPGGIQIAGTMPENIWVNWYDTLKKKLSEALGYEIGEPQNGFQFKYWEPFEKNYSDIKSIDSKEIVFNDYSTFNWEDFENIESDISANPPYFVFKSPYIELRIYFNEAGAFSKRKNERNFHDFQSKLKSIKLKV